MLLFASCHDDSDTLNYTPYEGRVGIAGLVSGPLIEEIHQVFPKASAYDGVSTDAPVFIAANDLESLSEAVWGAIEATFANQHPLALINPDAAQINYLLGKLGLNGAYRLPLGHARAEIFAIDIEAGGHLFQWVAVPPIVGGSALSSAGYDYVAEADDTPFLQLGRTDVFRQWLAQNGTRVTSRLTSQREQATQQLKSAMQVAGDTDSNLLDLAQAMVSTANFTIRLGKTQQNYYQITHYVYSCHAFSTSLATSSEWFYVIEQAAWNSSPGYRGIQHEPPSFSGIAQDTAGQYAHSYSVDHFIPMSVDDWTTPIASTGNVSLMATTPDSTSNVETVTSAINYNLGATVGFKGSSPVATLNGGASMTNSVSFNIQDVTVHNLSGADTNYNTKWNYVFARPSQTLAWDGIWPYGKLTAPTALSHETFQPVNQWIWRVDSSLRNSHPEFAFTTHFTVNLETAYGGVDGKYLDAFGITDISFETKPNDFYLYVPLNYPPTLVAPADMTFGAQGQTQLATLNVTGPWTASCDQSWCHVEASSGSATSNIHVTLDPNADGADRNAVITFMSQDGLSQDTTRVFQSQYP
jgi:hypothetical protein